MEIVVSIVNALVEHEEGGVPVGVVLDVELLTSFQKQHVASVVGVSETAFISNSQIADVKIEFYTPLKQIPHCSHATIAALSLLRELGQIKCGKRIIETSKGILHIFLEESITYIEQAEPRVVFLDNVSTEMGDSVYHAIGLSRSGQGSGMGPLVVNTDVNFLMVPLKDESTVSDATPDFSLIETMSQTFDLMGVYSFCTKTQDKGKDASTRMFAPRYGMDDEPASVLAAGPLASILHDHFNIQKRVYSFAQGHLMTPRTPCEIIVALDVQDGEIQQLAAGGKALLTGEKNLYI